MTQNTSSSVSFQHTIYLKTHYNTDYQAIRKEPQNSRICAQGDYNLKQGEFSEGFCKRIFNTYPHPLPKGGGANLQGKSSLCYGFPSHSNPLVTTKRAATLTSPQRRRSPNLQENHHCAMAFQAIATHWLTTKRAATLTSPQGRGARSCKENHHCTMAFQAIATHWLTTKELQL